MARDRKHIGAAPVDRSLGDLRPRRAPKAPKMPKAAKPRRSARRSRTAGIWRPWRKVGVLALIAGATIFGREGYVIARGAMTGGQCEVASVVDGDTVRLFCPGRGLLRARLNGYDTPEVFSPKCISEWWRGMQATWTLRKELWFADEVEIVLTGTDRYDRRLTTLVLDGRNIASTMISKGLARSYAGGQRSGWC